VLHDQPLSRRDRVNDEGQPGELPNALASLRLDGLPLSTSRVGSGVLVTWTFSVGGPCAPNVSAGHCVEIEAVEIEANAATAAAA
jgi:hypothetical protein